MQYTVTNHGTRYFEIVNENHEHIGKLEYTNWIPNNARITIQDLDIYEITRSGFWNTGKQIIKNGVLYAEIKARIGRGLEIVFENGRRYSFRKKGILSHEYVLADEDAGAIGEIRSEFKLSKFNFDYTINVQNEERNRETGWILPFVMIYCIKYMRARRAAH